MYLMLKIKRMTLMTGFVVQGHICGLVNEKAGRLQQTNKLF